jgi:hypothetical protein
MSIRLSFAGASRVGKVPQPRSVSPQESLALRSVTVNARAHMMIVMMMMMVVVVVMVMMMMMVMIMLMMIVVVVVVVVMMMMTMLQRGRLVDHAGASWRQGHPVRDAHGKPRGASAISAIGYICFLSIHRLNPNKDRMA